MIRFVSSVGAACLVAAVLLGSSGVASAQETEPTRTEETLTKKEKRQRAKQERIDRYLQKKEARKAQKAEKRARKEAEQQAEAQAKAAEEARAAAEAEAARAAEVAAVESADPASNVPPEPAPAQKPAAKETVAEVRMPRPLAEAQARLLRGPMGQDPDARPMLDVVQSGRATARDFGELGNLLARRGYTGDAIVYYRMALAAEPENESILLNLGTVHLARDELGSAESAFKAVLDRDPNHAFAYYNLGAVYRKANRYDEAVEAFRRALILDPDLGDPTKNAQAAINELMVPVKLELYQMKTGSLALPLQSIETAADRDR